MAVFFTDISVRPIDGSEKSILCSFLGYFSRSWGPLSPQAVEMIEVSQRKVEFPDLRVLRGLYGCVCVSAFCMSVCMRVRPCGCLFYFYSWRCTISAPHGLNCTTFSTYSDG